MQSSDTCNKNRTKNLWFLYPMHEENQGPKVEQKEITFISSKIIEPNQLTVMIHSQHTSLTNTAMMCPIRFPT